MDIKFQIQTLQKQTGFSQEKLAQLLGVSFATLNSWINERSVPRPKAAQKIKELYEKYTGETSLPQS